MATDRNKKGLAEANPLILLVVHVHLFLPCKSLMLLMFVVMRLFWDTHRDTCCLLLGGLSANNVSIKTDMQAATTARNETWFEYPV